MGGQLANAQQRPPETVKPVLDNSYHVAACYPHDPKAFTQGLFFYDGALYESTGHVGQSTIRRIHLESGEVEQLANVPPPFFGEGSVQWKDEILSLSWKAGVGFRWNLDDFKEKSRFSYAGEGWGLTRTDNELIMSDGTNQLRFIDPENFSEKRRIAVTANGRPIARLNELEWIDGKIWANIWMSSQIVGINPDSGAISSVINLKPLTDAIASSDFNAVLNGIAWDAKGERLLVTGKRWPWLFELRKGPPAKDAGCKALPAAKL
jgi:glutamine cyclotransferase